MLFFPERIHTYFFCSVHSCYYIEPFLHPLDWKQLGLTNYPTVIKQPIDLTMIKVCTAN